MEKFKRSLFFWTLVVLFLIIAPLVILHARGYRFDINRGIFVFSGSISFKCNPQTVDVKLNNKLSESKKLNMINNSYNISGLLPDDYNIQISADGFQTWSKKINVHSGVASEFWNVLLTRKDYEKTNVSVYEADKFFISPKNDFAVYIKNFEESASVGIFDINSQILKNSFDINGWKFIKDSKKENIEWSPDGSFISIPVQRVLQDPRNKKQSVEYSYFIADLENNFNFNLGQFLNIDDIRNVRWDPKEKGYLFFLRGNSLYRANVEDAASAAETASAVSAFDLSYTNVYYMQSENNLIFKESLNGKSEPIQVTSYFAGPENSLISKIVVYDDSRIALISEDKNLYIFNQGEKDKYFKKLADSIEGIQFSNDGKKMLFYTNNEISAYFLRDWNVQPARAENEMQNITRYSETIANVQWFSDYEHIIFNSGRWIKIIELDQRDHRNCLDLINTALESPFIVYNDYLKRLYFTDMKEEQNSIYYIAFPEKTSILNAVGI